MDEQNKGGIPSWIPMAGNLLATGGNILSSNRQNRKQMEYNREMWERQTAQQMQFWEMQNAYNHPREQMKRLQEAGLNPKLMYERGDMGNAGALNSPEEKSWTQQPENWGQGIGTAFESYFNVKQQKAQTDLTYEQIKLAKQDALLKTLDAAIKNTKKDRESVELEHFNEMRGLLIKQKLKDIQKTEAETKATLNEDERRAAMHSPNLIRAMEQIALIRANTARTEEDRKRIMQGVKNMKLDHQIKELNIQLMKDGIYPGDTIIARILSRLGIVDTLTTPPEDFHIPKSLGEFIWGKGKDLLNRSTNPPKGTEGW